MGINNTSNTGNQGLLTLGKQVTPNVSVTIPAYTANGWTAGDYLYNSATGVTTPPTGSATAGGPITTLQATTVSVTSGYLLSGTQTLVSPTRTAITYSGTTVNTDSALFSTVTFTAVSGAAANATLLNGNIAVAYYDNTLAGYYYAIYSQTGAVVLAPTLVAAVPSGFRPIVVALQSGGFSIFYSNYSTGSSSIKTYDSAGTLTATLGAISSVVIDRSYYNARGIQLAGGNVVYVFFRNSSYLWGVVTNAAGTTTLSNNNLNTTYLAYCYYDFALYPLPSTISSAPNGFGVLAYNASSEYNGAYGVFTASGTFVTAGQNALGPVYPYYGMDGIRLQDGSYVFAGSSSAGGQFIVKASMDSSGMPIVSGSSITLPTYSTGQTIKIVPQSGSGFAVVFYAGYVRSTGTTSDLTITSTVSIPGYSYLSASCGLNGAIYFSGTDSSGYLAFSAYSTNFSLVNGTAYIATLLSPPNYTFLGIAENTVSAGNTGNVIVSGQAIANSSMPSVSGTLYFDTTQTAMFGNKGYVTGRNLTLKGFE